MKEFIFLAEDAIGTTEDLIGLSLEVIRLVCNVDFTVGVIVDNDGNVNVAVVTCLGVVNVGGSMFNKVVGWVVVLAWVVEVVETFIDVSVDVFCLANNVVALVVVEA